MTLVVEDGTGLANAESFASVAEADTYLAKRGMTNWATLTTTEKEQALVRSTDYMEQAYRLLWKGNRVTATQALSWPREWVEREDYSSTSGLTGDIDGKFYYPSNVVPNEVKAACVTLAFKAASGDLAPDLDRLTKREKVDVIEVEYETGGVQYVRFRSVDMMLGPIVKIGGPGSQQVKLARC